MAIFEINSWTGGISSFNDRGQRGSAKFTSNLDIRKATDTLSSGQALEEEGLLSLSHSVSPSTSPSGSQSPSRSASRSASPSNSPSKSQSPSASPSRSVSASTSPSGSASPSSSVSSSPSPSAGLYNVFEGLIYFFVKCTDGNTYGFDNVGHIYRRLPGGHWRMVYTDPLGSIKGAEEKPSSTGTTYLQWATNNHLMRKPIPGSSDWTDVEVVASNLTGADWHTMRQVGGANHICNGSSLALVGYDDSYTNEALNLIPGNIGKTIVERNGRTVIGTVKAWDVTRGVNGMLDAEQPLAQIGENGELFYADFVNTMPVKRFPGGGKVNPGGVANEVDQVGIFDWEQGAQSWIDKQSLGNMSLWGVFNSTVDADATRNGVYTYGRKNKEQQVTLNLEYALDVDEIGAVVNVEGITLVSYRDGTDFGVRAVDPDNKAIGIYESLEFRPPIKKPETPTIWNYTELLIESLPVGCSIMYFYKTDHASTWTQAYTADGAASFATTNAKKAVFRIGEQGDVFEEKIRLIPNGNVSPIVLRSRTFFQ